MKSHIMFLISVLMLAACSAEVAEESATAVVPTTAPTAIPPIPTTAQMTEATAVPTSLPPPTSEPALAEPTELPPTDEPAPTMVPETAPVIVEYGRTAEGAFFHGAVDAPVTLIDYSDFL